MRDVGHEVKDNRCRGDRPASGRERQALAGLENGTSSFVPPGLGGFWHSAGHAKPRDQPGLRETQAFAVHLTFDFAKHFNHELERRWFAEDHFLPFSVVALQLGQAKVRRDRRVPGSVSVARPDRREKNFLVAGDL
jgi:hypothetical protein